MTWPIPTLPTNFANSTSQYDAHPLAHNQLADAINELVAHITLGAWSSYTPTLTQPSAITKTVTTATYTQIGKLVIASIHLSVTGAGTGANAIKVGLPVMARAANAIGGSAEFYDASASTRYVCLTVGMSTTEIGLVVNGASTDVLGISPNIALASGDGIHCTTIYEAV